VLPVTSILFSETSARKLEIYLHLKSSVFFYSLIYAKDIRLFFVAYFFVKLKQQFIFKVSLNFDQLI